MCSANDNYVLFQVWKKNINLSQRMMTKTQAVGCLDFLIHWEYYDNGVVSKTSAVRNRTEYHKMCHSVD